MIEAIQPNGTRPPLFLVHGQYGVTVIGPAVAKVLGPDQPLYVLHARGLDGAGEACQTVKAMAADHLAAIRKVPVSGPFLIGGVCSGSFVALEIARELLLQGREVGPVLLIDPGAVPHKSPARLKALEPILAKPAVRRQFHDQAAAKFRRYHAQSLALPFDARDPAQLERAAAIGATTSLAFARHRVSPFYGATELILCSDWARGFFVPQHEWQKILPGQRCFHVLQGGHEALLDTHLDKVSQLIGIYIEAALDTAPPAARDLTMLGGPPQTVANILSDGE